MSAGRVFTFDDAATFQQNIAAFSPELAKLHLQAGPCLAAMLPALERGDIDKPVVWNSLLAELQKIVLPTTPSAASHQQVQTVHLPPPPVIRWFIESLEIEGFRGINNEGNPLKLSLKPDAVNSISAPNGVGKSSIFDAVSFAVKGCIPKLEKLLQAEKPQEYYLNKFHQGNNATIKTTFRSSVGTSSVEVVVTRDTLGNRTVTSPTLANPDEFLSELNREFVLLDGTTFQSFIESKSLERGRSFSGLLGLASYSELRQQLQALSNTRAFNQHFETASAAARRSAAERIVAREKAVIAAEYEALVKRPLDPTTADTQLQQDCLGAALAIPLLSAHCNGRAFIDIDVNECVKLVRTAEDGPKRARLTQLLQLIARCEASEVSLPSDEDGEFLLSLATARAEAIKATSGQLFRDMYSLCNQIVSDPSWPAETLCPTCNVDVGISLRHRMQDKLNEYTAADAASNALTEEWQQRGWGTIHTIAQSVNGADDSPALLILKTAGDFGHVSPDEAKELFRYVSILRSQLSQEKASYSSEREDIERTLPPSLVEVTTIVETIRRLQSSLKSLKQASEEVLVETSAEQLVQRLKKFLEQASDAFSEAESAIATARLRRVEPLCQEFFKQIMFGSVVPSLQKPPGKEDLGIQLAEFWGLQNVSAQALLSESYRNGFAISVYLAAASLYGGPAGFLILDDVTSSLDAGHQHHLVELIRTRFARPLTPHGPQVILLSHDTLLEKLFNKYSGAAEWAHQRIEGTANTSVLPQSGAANSVRTTTLSLLNAGRTYEAAPRIRQYLEYTLHTIIDKCRIPVPLDLAFGDDKRTPGEYLNAIKNAVELEKRAGSLILTSLQEGHLQLHSASIVGNYLAHWSSGQTQAFSAPALLGVMQAIDDFADCFRYVTNPAAGTKKFYSSLNRR